jgi:hypothetical protein
MRIRIQNTVFLFHDGHPPFILLLYRIQEESEDGI